MLSTKFRWTRPPIDEFPKYEFPEYKLREDDELPPNAPIRLFVIKGDSEGNGACTCIGGGGGGGGGGGAGLVISEAKAWNFSTRA